MKISVPIAEGIFRGHLVQAVLKETQGQKKVSDLIEVIQGKKKHRV